MLFILAISCSETKTYYETPIESWLSKNLNDYSSYEPIEFSVLTNSNYLFDHIDFASVQNVVQRKLDLIPKLITEFKKLDGADLSEISTMSNYATDLSMLNNERDYPFILVDSVIKLLDKSFQIQAELIPKIHSTELLDLYAQYEGTTNRYYMEVDQQLEKFGTNLKDFDAEFKDGLFINHKFRAKNSFGAFVISSILFKLDNEKSSVLKAFDNK